MDEPASEKGPIDEVEASLSPESLGRIQQGDRAQLEGMLAGFLPKRYHALTGYSNAIVDAFYGALPADGALGRRRLSAEDRERCVLALLASQGEEFNLRIHVYYALLLKISPQEIAHIVWLAGIYSGINRLSDGLEQLVDTLKILEALDPEKQPSVLHAVLSIRAGKALNDDAKFRAALEALTGAGSSS